VGSTLHSDGIVTVLAFVWVVIVMTGGWIYERRSNRLTIAMATLLAHVWLPFAAVPLVYAPASKRWRSLVTARRDRQCITATLPDAIDLFLVAVQAGLTPELALRRLAPYLGGPIASATHEVFSRIEAGQRFGDALDALTEQLGEPMRPLVAAVTASERYGLPLAPALDVVATVSRDQRRRAAETAARRLPIRLSFPLVLCILPAFIILTVVPAIFGALRALP
jgi:tight adherence protein C